MLDFWQRREVRAQGRASQSRIPWSSNVATGPLKFQLTESRCDDVLEMFMLYLIALS